jgi:hypothetical protein
MVKAKQLIRLACEDVEARAGIVPEKNVNFTIHSLHKKLF